MLFSRQTELKKEYNGDFEIKIDIKNDLNKMDLYTLQNILGFLTTKEIAKSTEISKNFYNAASTLKLTANHLNLYALAWYNARQHNPSLAENPFITSPQRFGIDFIAKTEILLKKLIHSEELNELDRSYKLYINIFKSCPWHPDPRAAEQELIQNSAPCERLKFQCFVTVTTTSLINGGLIILLRDSNFVGIPLILFGMVAPCCIMKTMHDTYICCAKRLNNYRLDNYNNSFNQPLISKDKLEDFLIALHEIRQEELEQVASLSP